MILLGAQEAVDDEVNRAVDNEEEVLDGSEAKHPAGVGGEHSQAPAEVGSLTYTWLEKGLNIMGTNVQWSHVHIVFISCETVLNCFKKGPT